MKKVLFILFILAVLLPLYSFQGGPLKVGIVFERMGSLITHYGDLSFKKDSLLFEGKEREGKALEMFFEISYKDIEDVSVTGDYENFMKIYIDPRSEFHKDHRFLMHADNWLKTDYVKIELREPGNLRAAWKLGRKFKRFICENRKKK